MAIPRIYLTGRMAIEHGDRVVGERDFAGRQGRIAFAFLASNRHRSTIGRDELTDVLWPDAPPAEPDIALNAILSKLRGALRKARLGDAAGIDAMTRSIALRLPSSAWIDIEEAANAVDETEGAVRRGDESGAWGHANVAVSIAHRPFLPHEEASWIETQRARLRALLARGLHCLSCISERRGESALALQYAAEIIDIEPFRETAYQHLMRLHAAMGNRAEALRVFGRCRDLLRDELGTSPSTPTEQLLLEILGEAT